MTPKEWMVFTATKVAMLTVVVLLILATNYSTWDNVKDLRAALGIAAYYLVQTIVGAKIQEKFASKNADQTTQEKPE